MNILIDMNLSPAWAVYLAGEGFEAMHWSEAGPGNAPDTEIMTYARDNNYVVLTHDLDFGAILAVTHGEKPSVVQVRAEQLSPAALGHYVVSALRQMKAQLEDGALISVDPRRTRLRLLPFRTIS